MFRRLLIAVLLIPMWKAAASSSAPSTPNIVPTPLSVRSLPGAFKFSSGLRIVLGDRTGADDAAAVEALNEALVERSAASLRSSREAELRSTRAPMIYLGHPDSRLGRQHLSKRHLTFDGSLKEEGYVLTVGPDGVAVLGATPRGRFYGVMTLVQLMKTEKRSVLVPSVEVVDRPLQKVRGITDDVSRGQISTIDDFRRIIRFLARYKMNTYALYLEDMLVFPGHPAIGRGRGALTLAELKELDAYARRHHVELIPIFQTLGHWENILLLPEYRHLAEFPGAHTLNVSDERVFKLLDEMIGAVARHTSTAWFHMGADESWDVGLGANKGRVAASDIATVHAEHYHRVAAIIRKHGKRPMMYGDVILDHPAILPKLPKEMVVVDWQYWAGEQYPSAVTFREAGVPYIVSPAVYNFTGPFPNYVHTLINIRNFALEGYRNGSMGLLTSNWNDNGGEALRALNVYGYAWTGELAWNPERADVDSFSAAFFNDHFGSVEAGTAARLAYTLLSNPLNLTTWNELWRHPMLPLRQAPLNYLWRIEGIRTTAPVVGPLVETIKTKAIRNADHARYLSFIVELDRWFALKLEAAESIRRMASSPRPGSDRDSICAAALALSEQILPTLQALKEEFRSLWLTTNRPEGLEFLMQRYDRQAAYWNELRDQWRRGELWTNPENPAAWIYHPDGNPGKRDSSAVQVRNAVFQKNFNLPGDASISVAWLQLIGDTHARLEVNGAAVGEVVARRSLSLIVERERVKAWDIASHLRSGDNMIVIRTDSYGPFASAGVNVWCQVQRADEGPLVLHSDSTWTVAKAGEDPPEWRAARSVPFPFPVVAPHPATRRWSWLER
ncbi:MAG: beta-N-acetylhexosaminidase [Bacteroidetes bacterium]|jgi:hypothetical protein|nr:beta-N-acetylhexosaminidase [Bacteroidota bacterium]